VTVDIDGCTATDTVNIILNESPAIDLGEDVITCSLAAGVIDATPSNFTVAETTFSWTYQGNAISETGAIVDPSDYGYGTYEVTAYADSQDCATTQSISITERDDIGVELTSDDLVVN
jgi:hypothetical protein